MATCARPTLAAFKVERNVARFLQFHSNMQRNVGGSDSQAQYISMLKQTLESTSHILRMCCPNLSHICGGWGRRAASSKSKMASRLLPRSISFPFHFLIPIPWAGGFGEVQSGNGRGLTSIFVSDLFPLRGQNDLFYLFLKFLC